jgi:hypothetical protein
MPDDISLAKASHNQAGTNGSGGWAFLLLSEALHSGVEKGIDI